MSDSTGLDPAAASAASPAGGGGDDSKEAANLQREIRRLKRELVLRSAGRTHLRDALEATRDVGTPKSVKTRTPLGKTPSASERRTATKLRGIKPMSAAVARAELVLLLGPIADNLEHSGTRKDALLVQVCGKMPLHVGIVDAGAVVDILFTYPLVRLVHESVPPELLLRIHGAAVRC